ncbi:cytochrome P450 705A22-like [Henckelia pumila]|uniref:cytochrome P450 705A22-like n=1 Tax=Henckelia pumila TaxID=405737 RepID=UPI003C6E0A5F
MATTISTTDHIAKFLFISLVSVFAIRFFIKTRRRSNQNKQHMIPPSPPALPIIGHLHLLSRSLLHHSFQKLASRYGPLMMIRAGATTQYVISKGAIAKELFKTNDVKFATRPEFGSSDYLIYKDTLFSTQDYGKYWIFLKKICMMEVLSAQAINRFADVRKEELMKLVEVAANCSKNGAACDMGAEFMAMTNNLICGMAMSTRTSGSVTESREIREVV